MPRPKGRKSGYVVVTEEVKEGQKGEPEVQCIFCNRDLFIGGATRIRAHVLGNKPGLGVAACELEKSMLRRTWQLL